MPKAVLMTGPGEDLKVENLAEPELEPGSVLLKTIASEVCGTDVHLWHGHLAGVPYPIIPGHVSVGEVLETRPWADGSPVTSSDGQVLRTGDVITFLDVHETCNNCWYCLVAKASTRCPHRKVYGITYSAEDGLLGGWSEAIYLKPGVKTVRLPEGLAPETFIAGGCGLPTAFHAVERAGIRMGDTVVVQGSGPVGLNTAIFAQLAGAAKVILIGGPEQRLQRGQELGVDAVIDIDEVDAKGRLERVRELTAGRGADVTIEATGVPGAVSEGLDLTRDAGTFVVVGQYTDAGEISINPHLQLNQKHLDVRGCWGSDFSHFYRAILMMAKYQGRFNWDRLISRRFNLDEAQQALEAVAGWSVTKALVVPD